LLLLASVLWVIAGGGQHAGAVLVVLVLVLVLLVMVPLLCLSDWIVGWMEV
jgi:hypothetical protein